MTNSKSEFIKNISNQQNAMEQYQNTLNKLQARLGTFVYVLDEHDTTITNRLTYLETQIHQCEDISERIQQALTVLNKIEPKDFTNLHQNIKDEIKSLELTLDTFQLPTLKGLSNEISTIEQAIMPLKKKLEELGQVQINQDSLNNQLLLQVEQATTQVIPEIQSLVIHKLETQMMERLKQERSLWILYGMIGLFVLLIPLDSWLTYQTGVNVKAISQQRDQINNNSEIIKRQEAIIQDQIRHRR